MAYQANNFDKLKLSSGNSGLYGDLTITSLLLNGYWDFMKFNSFTPLCGSRDKRAENTVGGWNKAVDMPEGGLRHACRV